MKCIRCGEEFSSIGSGFIEIKYRHDINEPLKLAYLCADCENDMLDYLEEKIER